MSAALASGASSIVGRFLLPRLLDAGMTVHALSRRPAPDAPPPGLHWHRLDIGQGLGTLDVRDVSLLFHLAPLWLLPPLLPELAGRGVVRLVALGSTSRFTKQDSRGAGERRLAQALAEAEERLATRCAESGIEWTLLRPTLIYADGLDHNVSAVARFVRAFGFFPLAGQGRGCRQPVHADDLAQACLAVLASPASVGRAYDVPGGSRLTYREMVEAICRAQGRRPRLVSLPVPLLRGLLRAASWLPGLRHLTPEMADRMDRDQCFDSVEARHDFGYAPREFLGPSLRPR